MTGFERILVVSRMTQYCREAVEQGISLARKYGSELYVIHVVHNPFGYEGWNLPIVSLEKDYQRLLAGTKADLDQLVKAAKDEGLPVTVLIREGEPTAEIVAAVKAHQVDLMIMLAHEEGRLEHFLFGRSNDDLVRRMPCSIMLVKKEPQPLG
ncbi:universal stress protein [Desulfuromonas carbonis]|uniref:universal stress protein n=1 Tax=Desulfuromonas sp. DDH964 TaxID=1823759 RepID=UPI00078E1EC4|nr:universal stress protein [Desulfuromonas sp. DDH964]AMV71339.1 universal stress protein Usp [Desulfuromonas sp. DDH964]